MPSITRNQIESYYKDDWSEIIPTSATNLLIELTCQYYQIGKLSKQTLSSTKEEIKPQDLGQV